LKTALDSDDVKRANHHGLGRAGKGGTVTAKVHHIRQKAEGSILKEQEGLMGKG
jgi:hypothetical protein